MSRAGKIYHALALCGRVVAEGKSVEEACHQAGISTRTYYRYRKRYAGMSVFQIQRQVELEKRTRRLEWQIREQQSEVDLLRNITQCMHPRRRRRAIRMARLQAGISERRACRITSHSRGAQRFKPLPVEPCKVALADAIHRIHRRHPRYGYRRIHAVLRMQGWDVGLDTVGRRCKKMGLKPASGKTKREHIKIGPDGIERHAASHCNEVWAWDLIQDQTMTGENLVWFALIDEFSRECLALHVRHRMSAKAVIQFIGEVLEHRDPPRCLRSDNAPLWKAKAVRSWLQQSGIHISYIEPGAPWENSHVESFNSHFRDEFLDTEVFHSLVDASELTQFWIDEYNTYRPHSALGYIPPRVFSSKGETRIPQSTWIDIAAQGDAAAESE